MRPLDEARSEVLAAMTQLDSESIRLEQAHDRVLRESAVALHDVPPFSNSAMDGFAVQAGDLEKFPVELRILEDVPAGSVPSFTVRAGTATKIMTGAPMPAGADAVVKVELTEQPSADTVRIHEGVSVGTAVRGPGSDFPRGTTVVSAGQRLGPVELALLATVGVAEPTVSRRPIAAVMSTGDELRPPETAELAPGQIRDSNRPLMRALLAEAGAEVLDFGIIGDTESALTAALDEASAKADVIVTSGGVSMGEYDLIKLVLQQRGDVGFWQVAMQPAKPFAFGHVGGTPLFGLPGNPVSVMVAFEQFTRPALLHMQGASELRRPQIAVALGQGLDTDPEKTVFVRVRLAERDGRQVAVLSGGQGSHMLAAVAAADGFAVVPAGVGSLAEGDIVAVDLFRHPSRSLT